MKLAKLCLLSCALLSALVFSGCATVTRGTTETLMIQSNPAGAEVRLSNGFTGRTPFTCTVPRKGDLIVTVSHSGYKTQEHILRSEVAGKGAAGVAGNVLIGGIIGIGVDAATGAALSHKPNPLMVTLEPVESAPQSPLPAPVDPGVASPVAVLSPAPSAEASERAVAADRPESASASPGEADGAAVTVAARAQ